MPAPGSTRRHRDAPTRRGRTLAELLKGWFSDITVAVDPQSVVVTATRRETRPPAMPMEVLIDRAEWVRFAPEGRRRATRDWTRAELIGALQAWADANGRSPTSTDSAVATAG